MTLSATPLCVLTRQELGVLEGVNRGDEYAGNYDAEAVIAGRLALIGLLLRCRGQLSPWRLTLVGRRVLREHVERAEP